MNIELFGLPGSGKTYIAEKMSGEQNMSLISAVSGGQRFWYALLFSLRRPFFVFYMLVEIFSETRGNRPLLKHKVLFLLPNTLSKIQKSKRTKDCLYDEGLFTFILGIYEHRLSSERLRRYLKYISPRDITVHIFQVKKEVRDARMKERKRHPRNFLGKEYIEHFYPIWDHNFSIMSEFIKKNYNYKINNNH